jgi:hypothetical protein
VAKAAPDGSTLLVEAIGRASGLMIARIPRALPSGGGIAHFWLTGSAHVLFSELSRSLYRPQCGFAGSDGGNPLSVADERRKLSSKWRKRSGVNGERSIVRLNPFRSRQSP